MHERATDAGGKGFAARRIVRTARFEVDASPDTVFPLLCPVREREWIEGWKADLVYSESGLVEDGCIFRTESPLLGEAIYVTSRHEKEKGIVEFVVFFPGKCIQKLDIALSPRAGGGTSLRWRRTYTGLSREGNALLEGITEEVFRKQTAALAQSLARYAMQLEGQ